MAAATRKLTLSFDNGPSSATTPGVLEALRQRRLPATFFVCGKDIVSPKRRLLLNDIKRDGHRLGNHTMTHTLELGSSDDPLAPQREIGEAQEILGSFAESDRWFRPYGGGGVLGPRLLSTHAIRYLCDGSYSCVLWNSVPRDWEDIDGWPERAFADIDRQDWTLVVLHDVPTGAMRQLPRFLDELLERNIEVRSDFPPACVPILRGRLVGDVGHLIPAETEA